MQWHKTVKIKNYIAMAGERTSLEHEVNAT